MTLNTGQKEAVKQLVQLKEGGLTLLGEGGVGKTYCIMAAAKQWLATGNRVALTAPTNKAVKQLIKEATRQGIQPGTVTFCTIHKALGLALLPDAAKPYVKQVGDCIFDQFDIVVIDEGSMVSSRAFFNYILPEAEKAGTPLVIMGDKMQLPPVRETESAALVHFPEIELTKNERFEDGGPISVLTKALRKVIELKGTFKFNAASHGVEVVKPAHFMNRVTSEFTLDTDLEQTRALAWSNIRVNAINQAVRAKLYGKDCATYEVGERVVTGKPIYSDRDLILSTDEECIVRNSQLSSFMCEESGKEYNTYLLTIEPVYDETVSTVTCHVIHESSQLEFTEDLNELYRRAEKSDSRQMWAKYNAFKDLFSDIRYCYCITVHRSQGSTYQTVMVDVDNILKNRRKQERNQLLYVAFSRAAKHLVTSKEQFVS